jgi:glycosyltransferase involved in cell wall biosynthesis
MLVKKLPFELQNPFSISYPKLEPSRAVQQARSLRLTLVTQFYPPDYAPTGQLLEELVHQLRQQGIQVRVFTGQPGYAFQQEAAAKVEQFPNLLIRRSATSRLWFQRIRGKAINGLLFWLRAAVYLLNPQHWGDVLLLPTAPPFLPILGYLLHGLFRRPYVCLLYDLYPDVAIELKVLTANHWLVQLWRKINRHVWQAADRVIVLSPTMRDRVLQHCPEIADKVAIIHNWCDPGAIVPMPKSQNWFALKHGLTEKFTVLYSGNMGRCHDIDTILAAAILLKDQPIQFVFIGNGAKRQPAIAQVQQLGLQNVLFLPYQDKETLPYSLTACDLSLVSISPGMEGSIAPSKFYSALASGRPIAVIAEPHSYLQQILTEANCGQRCSNGDSEGLATFIQTLATQPQQAEKMGTLGRRYLQQHFTPNLIAQHYARILRDVANTTW